MNFAYRAGEINEYIINIRRHIHAHPELSFNERKTTAYIADKLEEMGVEVQRFDDYTGCIGTMRGRNGGKIVLLRADIDALPIKECSGVEFESENDGVMHACGHDCHTAMLLGAAKLLSEHKDELRGTVKLLFQAAEECFVGSHYYWGQRLPWRHRCGNGHACLAHGGIRPHGHNGRLPYGKLRQFPHNRARARSA